MIHRRGLLAVVVLLLATQPATSDEPAGANKCFLVEMNCDPTDVRAVSTTLLTALSLREDQSDVTLFLDLQAVPLAKPANSDQSPPLRRETDRLFAKLRKAGIRVIVCPHCAVQFHVGAEDLRDGIHFTTKKELDDLKSRADQIYEYRPAEPADNGEEGESNGTRTA